jgi:hypothetical protein
MWWPWVLMQCASIVVWDILPIAYIWTIFSANKNETNTEEETLHWQILLVELSSHWFMFENRPHTWQSIHVFLAAILEEASYWLLGREVSIPVAQVSSISYRWKRVRKKNRKHRVIQCRNFIAIEKASWDVIWIS